MTLSQQEQYRYCYQAAQEYKQQNSVYQNTWPVYCLLPWQCVTKGGFNWEIKEHWNSSLYYNKTGLSISCGILVFNVLLPFIESKLFTLIQCHNTTPVVLLLISLSHLREVDVGSKFCTYHIYPTVTGKAPDARSHPKNARLSPCKPCNV